MPSTHPRWFIGLTALWLAGASCGGVVWAADGQNLESENAELKQRVSALEEQLLALQARVAALADQHEALRDGRGNRMGRAMDLATTAAVPDRTEVVRPGGVGRVVISGEVGVTYSEGGAQSDVPAGEFRVDDAKLYVDAEVARGIYAFAEIDVTARENSDPFQMGEIYLEVEDFAGRLGWTGAPNLTLRMGRLDGPFGEEYQRRGMLTNPLITHSLADFWGVDEGLEVFGSNGGLSYVVAVQNGSRPASQDFTGDKAVTVRVGYEVNAQWRLTASAMRTGEIAVAQETLSELWWGGGFLRSIGATGKTTAFSANLWQLEGSWRWSTGHLLAAGGVVNYEDNDTSRDNGRAMTFGSLEVMQKLGEQGFGAVRFSRIDADGGYPIVGHGNFGKYLFGPFFSDDVWRVSAGLGFWLTEDFGLKAEYSWEGGTLTSGADRVGMNRFATQAAVRF